MSRTVYDAIRFLLQIVEILILARVLLSWIPIPRYSQIIRLIYMLTEPILGPIRNMLQKSYYARNLMIDLSPIVAFILLFVIRYIVTRIYIASTIPQVFGI